MYLTKLVQNEFISKYVIKYTKNHKSLGDLMRHFEDNYSL